MPNKPGEKYDPDTLKIVFTRDKKTGEEGAVAHWPGDEIGEDQLEEIYSADVIEVVEVEIVDGRMKDTVHALEAIEKIVEVENSIELVLEAVALAVKKATEAKMKKAL